MPRKPTRLRRRDACRRRRRGARSQARADADAGAGDLRAHPRRRRQPAGRGRHRAAVDQPDLRARGPVAAGALPLLPEQVRRAGRAGRAADDEPERPARAMGDAGHDEAAGREVRGAHPPAVPATRWRSRARPSPANGSRARCAPCPRSRRCASSRTSTSPACWWPPSRSPSPRCRRRACAWCRAWRSR